MSVTRVSTPCLGAAGVCPPTFPFGWFEPFDGIFRGIFCGIFLDSRICTLDGEAISRSLPAAAPSRCQKYPVHFGQGELGGPFTPAVFHNPTQTESMMLRSHRRGASWDPNCQVYFAPHGLVRRDGGGSEMGMGGYGEAGGAGGVQGPWGAAVDVTR